MSLLLRRGTILEAAGPVTADVLIEGDRIARVGADIPAPPGAATIDLGGDVVIPGLVNAHYHSPDELSTGRVPDAPLELWSMTSMPLRSGPASDLRLAALWGAARMLRGGVTAAIDMVRTWPDLDGARIDAVAGAYLSAGMRAAIAPVVGDLPAERTMPLAPWTPYRADPDVVRISIGILDELRARWDGRDGRISLQVAPSGPQRCSDELFAATLDLARRQGTMLHTHALETRAQAEQARLRWGLPLIRHLEQVGALGPRTTLAHVVWPEDGDPELLAATGTVVVHNPASNLVLGSGRSPLPRLLWAGVRVALGSDAATCNDGVSLFDAMRLATIVHRPDEPDWTAWPSARDALRLATAGGAAALGRSEELGRLAAGYLADVVVLDARAPALVPPNDLARQIVMRGASDMVRHVVVAGEIVVRDGRLLTLDWDALVDEVRAIAATRPPAGPADTTSGPVAEMLRRMRGA